MPSDEDADKSENIQKDMHLKSTVQNVRPLLDTLLNSHRHPPHKRVKKSKSDVFSRTSFYILFISSFLVKHLQKYTRKEP